ncbi:hypothetical protein BCV70DRAFT_41307 [Testicularia cyperi]|uniref:Uncharacterized protein n=1 Tax=Testicularia cyperi TaxID=1882483 RepID=A0A317XIJ6_9BASI|nr:hypothetical protein BCV70DRAFT_41307 [Testicularia cyperi]
MPALALLPKGTITRARGKQYYTDNLFPKPLRRTLISRSPLSFWKPSPPCRLSPHSLMQHCNCDLGWYRHLSVQACRSHFCRVERQSSCPTACEEEKKGQRKGFATCSPLMFYGSARIMMHFRQLFLSCQKIE